MNLALYSAIQSRSIISFNYEGGVRIVEPYCYGVSTTGNEVLRGYQIKGYSASGNSFPFKLFDVSKISGLAQTGEHFLKNRKEYNPNDSAMKHIYCSVR